MMRLLRCATLMLALFCPLAPVAWASQSTLVTPGAPLSMTALASFLNGALLSVGSCNAGNGAPANGTGGAAFAGECWINTTANPWVFSRTADGVHWSAFGTLNTASFVWTPQSNGFGASLGGALTTAAALTQAGLFPTTLTVTGTTNSTLPAGSHTLAGLDVSQTWSGSNNFSGAFQIAGTTESFPASGNLVGTSDTQALTGKSYNGLTISPSTGTLTVANGKTLTDTSGIGASVLLGAAGGGFSAYAGGSCTNQMVTALSAAAALTCNSITNSYLASGTFANVTGTGTLTAGATGTGFTIALSTSTVAGTLPAGAFPALTGDVTTTAGSLATTLATVNSNIGTFGSSTSVPQITLNGKGLVTGAGSNAIPTASSVSPGLAKCDGSTITCSGGNFVAIGAASSSIAVGTTGVTGGTSAALLYDNAGTLGNQSLATLFGNLATFSATPTAPTGATSTVMMGLGASCKITPAVTGRVLVTFYQNVFHSAVGGSVQIQLYYGTGTAPSNGAAATGTAYGSNPGMEQATAPFFTTVTITAVITGLTPGTPYWFDEKMTTSGGTGGLSQITCNGLEY